MAAMSAGGPRESGAVHSRQVGDRPRCDALAGRLERADAVGEAGSVTCGGLVRIELALADGLVREARYQAYGCPATLACTRETTARVSGVPFLEAASLSEAAIGAAVGLSPADQASAGLALDALHAALGNAAVSFAGASLSGRESDENGVLVGMSGGVDSAVAAMLLKEEGYGVVGATLRLWSDPGPGAERSCCSPETVRRARRVAHGLGLPHLTIDASKAFYEQVVRYFVAEYEAGRTPNPCAKCNARVRFGLMLDVAGRLGLRRIATGHYARLAGDPPYLARGADRLKDQSYVLAEVGPDVLRQVIFPLGAMTKAEVRELAGRAQLEGHAVPESQEICFVPDDDHRRFLRDELGESPGTIEDREGRVVGRHSGTYNFTVGQRKGLGIAGESPSYVVALDAERGVVVVGEASDLAVGEVTIGGLVRHRPRAATQTSLQLRSMGAAVPAHVGGAGRPGADTTREEQVSVVLDKPVCGVAPGQTAVVYDGDEVVTLAGTIVATAPWTEETRAPG